MPTAALYLRISQDATGTAAGVARQEAECRALAVRLGLDVGTVYVDNDLSATSGRVRPGFEALLADAPGVVVCWHTDRLVRVSRDLERVLDLGLTVHAVTAGHLDLSTPAGRAVARTVTAWATYEGEQKAARQRSRNAQDAGLGRPYWRRRPFGWNLDGSMVPAEAEAIREGCARILAGWSLAAVTRAWNEAGHLTPVSGSMGGMAWTTQGVRRVLIAHRIAGIREYQGAEYPGTWTPAVPEDTWRAVRAVLLDPRRNSKVRTGKVATSLLAGIARCGKCGGLMHTDTSRGDPAYRCTENRHVNRKGAPIDDTVVTETARLLTLPGVFEAVHEDTDDAGRSALLTERAALVRRRDEEIPGMVAAGLSLAQIKTANDAVVARLAEVDAELERSTPDTSLHSAVLDATRFTDARAAWLADVWKPMPLEARRSVVRALWAVTVAPLSVEPTALAWRLIERAGATEWYAVT